MKTLETKIKRCQKRVIYWKKEISKIPHLNKHREVKHKLFERFLKYRQYHIDRIFELQKQQKKSHETIFLKPFKSLWEKTKMV